MTRGRSKGTTKKKPNPKEKPVLAGQPAVTEPEEPKADGEETPRAETLKESKAMQDEGTASPVLAGEPIATKLERVSITDAVPEPPMSYGDIYRGKMEDKKIANLPVDKLTHPVIDSEIEAEEFTENDMLLPTRELLGHFRRTILASLKLLDRLFSTHERREAQRKQAFEQEQLKKQATPETGK